MMERILPPGGLGPNVVGAGGGNTNILNAQFSRAENDRLTRQLAEARAEIARLTAERDAIRAEKAKLEWLVDVLAKRVSAYVTDGVHSLDASAIAESQKWKEGK